MTYAPKSGSGCSGQAEGVDLPTRGEASHTSYRYSILRLSILRHQIKRPRDLYFYPDTLLSLHVMIISIKVSKRSSNSTPILNKHDEC